MSTPQNYPPGMTAYDIPGWDDEEEVDCDNDVATFTRCAALFCRVPHEHGDKFCANHRDEFDTEAGI